MKLTLFALSFASLPTLFTLVQGQSSLSLFFPADPDSGSDDSSPLPTPTVWADPIGTASGGSETTYVINEIDSGDAALFGDVQSGTTVVTTSFTVVASASGFRFTNIASISGDCTLGPSSSVGCVEVGQADVNQTDLVTFTETGSASALEVSISAPTQAATGGSGSSGSSSPSSTAGAKNGAVQLGLGPRFLGFVSAGLLVGVSVVLL